MTMRGARTVEVDGKTYSYVLKKAKGLQLPNWAVRLVVHFGPKQYVNLTFEMTAPTMPVAVAKEMSGFTPALVSNVVRALEFYQGKLPERFETAGWRLASPSAEDVEATDD